MGGLGRQEGVDHLDCGHIEHRVLLLAGGVAQGNRQMGLTESHSAHKDDVGMVFQKGQPEEVLDLRPVDLLGPAPVELFQGFEHWEAGGDDTPSHRAVHLPQGLPFHQAAQVIHRRPVLLGGLVGQTLIVLLHIGQLELGQVRLQLSLGGIHRSPPSWS